MIDLDTVGKWVKQQPWHSGKVGAIGWSHGGLIVGLYSDKEQAKGNIDAMVNYYGGCNIGRNPSVPLLILMGEKDDWTPSFQCVGLEIANNPEVIIYPDAYHGWDQYRTFPTVYKGHHLEYNEAITKQSENKVQNFFKKYLKSN